MAAALRDVTRYLPTAAYQPASSKQATNRKQQAALSWLTATGKQKKHVTWRLCCCHPVAATTRDVTRSFPRRRT